MTELPNHDDVQGRSTERQYFLYLSDVHWGKLRARLGVSAVALSPHCASRLGGRAVDVLGNM
jgi:hypothetical protein